MPPRQEHGVCEMCEARGIVTLHPIDGRETWVCGKCDPVDHRGEKTILVVVVHPGGPPVARIVWDDDRVFDRIVGGTSAFVTGVIAGAASDFLTAHHRDADATLKPNRMIDGNEVRGPFVVCRLGPEDRGLTERDAEIVISALD